MLSTDSQTQVSGGASQNHDSVNSRYRSLSMAKKIAPVPKGYRTATPYLIVNHAPAALDFYHCLLYTSDAADD